MEEIINNIPEPKNNKQYGGVIMLLGLVAFLVTVRNYFGFEVSKQDDSTM